MTTRTDTALAAAAALLAATPSAFPALLGFDGFVDDIIDVVDKRHAHDRYDRLLTIPSFAGKIAAAAGQSSNMEMVIKQQKLGGNGPIMANAMAALGLPTTYVGTTGYPAPHPVFNEFARKATLLPLAQPAHTSALEFSDGKIMLGNLAPLAEVTWDRIVSHVGLESFRALCDTAALIGAVNWTMLPHLTPIWQHLLTDILPTLSKKPRLFFVDLADPEKRLPADLLAALSVLCEINLITPVVLGLNLSEALQVAAALELPCEPLPPLATLAATLRQALKLNTVVIHPRTGAAAATADEVAQFEGPFIQSPRISTGAGDHFNAGFVFSRLLGLSLPQALAAATATSGYYVRTALSPTLPALAEFLNHLPPPE